MRKVTTVTILVSLLVLTPAVVFAQNGQGQSNKPENAGNGSGQSMKDQDLPPQGEQRGKQENGDDVEIQIESVDSEDDNAGKGKGRSANFPNNRSEVARQKMSEVAKYVEDLLADETITGGIGEQVSEFAKEQKQIQQQVQNQYQELKGRGQVMRFLFGEDKEALKESKELLQQNRERVRELQDFLGDQLPEEQEEAVQSLIDSLSDQNAVLEDEVDAEESVTGVLEWLTDLIR